MATKIPSHNISSIYAACYHIIDKMLVGEEVDIEDIIQIVQAPDFATGGSIIGLSGVKEGYRTGKGKVTLRGKYRVLEDKKGDTIIIDELPFGVNKQKLIIDIIDLMKDTKDNKGKILKTSIFPQIKEIRDESDKDGMRIVIEIKKDESSEIVINNLIKNTKFQVNFNMNMLSLAGGEPKQLNLLQMIEEFLSHAASVIIRKAEYDLAKANKRLNIVSGILKAVETEEMIVSIIDIIRHSEDIIADLMNIHGFNELQADYIAEMKIRALSNSNVEKLTEESQELNYNISKYTAITTEDSALLSEMKFRFEELDQQFADERRTTIEVDTGSIEEEDLIKEETLIITYTTDGTIKAVEEAEYKSQKRGGVGVKATNTKDDEIIKFMFTSSSKDDLLFFTTEGRCHLLKAYKIGKSSKAAKGRNINNYLTLNIGEKIVSVLNTSIKNKDNCLLFITKNGQLKKLSLEQLSNRFSVTKVINFKEDDKLVQALLVQENDTVLIVTGKGKSVRIDTTTAIRPTGRTAMGVIGINVAENDNVVDMCIVKDEDLILTISSNGLGKRTKAKEWSVKGRGGKGMVAHDITAKTGEIVSVLTADNDDELFIATEQGLLTRISTKDIRVCGRSSQGVKVINIKSNEDQVASVSVNRNKEDEDLIEE